MPAVGTKVMIQFENELASSAIQTANALGKTFDPFGGAQFAGSGFSSNDLYDNKLFGNFDSPKLFESKNITSKINDSIVSKLDVFHKNFVEPSNDVLSPNKSFGELMDASERKRYNEYWADKEAVNSAGSKLIECNNYENNVVFKNTIYYVSSDRGTGNVYKVFQRSDIDWNMVRTTGAKKGRGLANAVASERYGLAPILDADGSVVTLHHSQQNSIGPLFEASTRYHNIRNAKKVPLHPYKGQLNPFNPMSEETRKLFQKFDSIEYWKIRGREVLNK